MLIAENPLADLSFSKDTLCPFFRISLALFWWKNTFSFELLLFLKKKLESLESSLS
jgi:hypothetical protein